jgi:4-alpha-glucanotransferase
MRVGLYQDLAIGSSPTGADSWAYADHFVDGVTVGAPPDPYSADGQNWGLPPLDPRALKRGGYRYFIDLIRAAFRHAGALRIDHVMGLFRLFWIPQGMSGRDGAYVRYPAEDLLGIIALESVRHRALVVGEDLGTVPAEVPPRLSKWGVLSSKVLYFERESDGTFKRADRYPALALATANTHDMPTIAGFWSERDIELRRELGLIAAGEEEARARAERDRDRGALVQLLDEERIIPGGAPQSSAELRAAVHGFLWSTPSQLVGLSLDDLAGETEAVNVPGVGGDRYPSWTRKMRADLEAITSSDEADVILARTRPG